MDKYSTEFLNEVQEEDEQNLWKDQTELHFAGVLECLWHDGSLDEHPPTQDAWVDEVADKLEISRLLGMKLLQKMEDSDGQVAGRLTTKSVRDWRVKLYVREGDSRMRWMRRSRYVAREFALDRGDDTFSPATRAPTSNKFPVVFLKMMHDIKEYLQQLVVLSSLVIGDDFLQVTQEQPLKVTLHGQNYVVLKNLTGQRLRAK